MLKSLFSQVEGSLKEVNFDVLVGGVTMTFTRGCDFLKLFY